MTEKELSEHISKMAYEYSSSIIEQLYGIYFFFDLHKEKLKLASNIQPTNRFDFILINISCLFLSLLFGEQVILNYVLGFVSYILVATLLGYAGAATHGTNFSKCSHFVTIIFVMSTLNINFAAGMGMIYPFLFYLVCFENIRKGAAPP